MFASEKQYIRKQDMGKSGEIAEILQGPITPEIVAVVRQEVSRRLLGVAPNVLDYADDSDYMN